MKLLPRRSAGSPDETPEPAEVVLDASGATAAKGRPTPKRRDAAPRRAAITQPPRNRREAYRWQKEQAKRGGSTAIPTTREAQREALARGDESALPRRDRGPLRRLARDWADSHRMLSNYLLLIIPLMVIGSVVPFATLAVLVLLIILVAEWWFTGRRIIALARERDIPVQGGPLGLGFYVGTRAYLPRRWRLPKPQVGMGDPI